MSKRRPPTLRVIGYDPWGNTIGAIFFTGLVLGMFLLVSIVANYLPVGIKSRSDSELSLKRTVRPKDDDMPFEFMSQGVFDSFPAINWRMYKDYEAGIRILVIYGNRTCATTILPLVQDDRGEKPCMK